MSDRVDGWIGMEMLWVGFGSDTWIWSILWSTLAVDPDMRLNSPSATIKF